MLTPAARDDKLLAIPTIFTTRSKQRLRLEESGRPISSYSRVKPTFTLTDASDAATAVPGAFPRSETRTYHLNQDDACEGVRTRGRAPTAVAAEAR